MEENESLLKKTMKKLLDEKLSEAEAQTLRDEGFILKNPTRKAAIAIAIYKKAAAGDLPAIKELRSVVCEGTPEKQNGRAVMIIDDIRD